MKILSKVEINENEVAVILENGVFGITMKGVIKTDKRGNESVRTFFVRNSFIPQKIAMSELEVMSKIEAISKFGQFIRNENGQIINLSNYYEGK